MQNSTVPHTRALERPGWLTDEVWPLPSAVIDADGVDVHFVDVGDGPVLVFVHTGFWSIVWRDLIMRLRGAFRCISIDFPSSGLSGRAKGKPTLEGHGRVLESVLDALAIQRYTLVCHDLGAMAGLSLAARRPERVEGIVAVNTFAWPPGRVLRAMLGFMGSGPIREFNTVTNVVPRLTATRFGVGRNFDRATRRAFLRPLRRRHRRRAFHHLMRDAARSREQLASIEAALRGPLADRPVLTVFGERNDPFHFQDRWIQMFPTAGRIVVPKGNHFPMCDDPDLVARSVRSWHTGVAPYAPGTIVAPDSTTTPAIKAKS